MSVTEGSADQGEQMGGGGCGARGGGGGGGAHGGGGGNGKDWRFEDEKNVFS